MNQNQMYTATPAILRSSFMALMIMLVNCSALAKTNTMKPEEINARFAQAFNSGKMENILALYEKNAVVHSSATQADQGHQKIAAGLKPLLALGGQMQATNVFVSQSGGIALLRADWKLTGAKKEDGSPLELGGTSIEVVRQQPNGTWLYVIDQPFGK
tara:strand:- start:60942 stop:61415 length:474 start_codon:yes stop_codon:yes gene_type:complete